VAALLAKDQIQMAALLLAQQVGGNADLQFDRGVP